MWSASAASWSRGICEAWRHYGIADPHLQEGEGHQRDGAEDDERSRHGCREAAGAALDDATDEAGEARGGEHLPGHVEGVRSRATAPGAGRA